MNYIELLKDEHKKMLWFLEQCKQIGINSDQGKNLFNSAKETLLGHLQLEDNELYPILREAAKQNRELSETLDLFASEMNEISEAVLNFFEKYKDGDKSNSFVNDFDIILNKLADRIFKEESILYFEYAKLSPNKDYTIENDSSFRDIKEQYFNGIHS